MNKINFKTIIEFINFKFLTDALDQTELQIEVNIVNCEPTSSYQIRFLGRKNGEIAEINEHLTVEGTTNNVGLEFTFGLKSVNPVVGLGSAQFYNRMFSEGEYEMNVHIYRRYMNEDYKCRSDPQGRFSLKFSTFKI